MAICAFEAIQVLYEYMDGNFDPSVESFVEHLNKIDGVQLDASMYSTLEEVMHDFVEEYVA